MHQPQPARRHTGCCCLLAAMEQRLPETWLLVIGLKVQICDYLKFQLLWVALSLSLPFDILVSLGGICKLNTSFWPFKIKSICFRIWDDKRDLKIMYHSILRHDQSWHYIVYNFKDFVFLLLNYVYGCVSMCGSRYPVPEEGIGSLLNLL